MWNFREKRENRRKDKAHSWKGTFLEVVLWVPEILLFPLRVLYVLVKMVLHAFRHIIDGF